MNKHSRNKLIRLLNEAKDACKEEAKKIEKKYQSIIEKELNYRATNIIDRFYADYPDPHVYDRWGDLYNVFKVTVNDKVWEIKMSPNYMKYDHGVPNEYIYTLAFQYGYHGGAIDGEDHPAPGVPYYRTFPNYKTWSRPAEFADFSPFREMQEMCEKYIDEIVDEMQAEYEKNMNKYFDKLEQQIEKVFQQGGK